MTVCCSARAIPQLCTADCWSARAILQLCIYRWQLKCTGKESAMHSCQLKCTGMASAVRGSRLKCTGNSSAVHSCLLKCTGITSAVHRCLLVKCIRNVAQSRLGTSVCISRQKFVCQTVDWALFGCNFERTGNYLANIIGIRFYTFPSARCRHLC